MPDSNLIHAWTGPVFLADSWRFHAGRGGLLGECGLCVDDLERSEWSPRFEHLMRNRLLLGALRYGRLNEAGKPRWDRLHRIEKDIQRYRETGNDEILVDIANHAMLEFEEGAHPAKHFASTDDAVHTVQRKY